MHLKLVPSGEKQDVETTEKEERTEKPVKKDVDQHIEPKLSENAKLVVLAFILGFIPLFSYTVGESQFGHEVGVHIAVGVGALCVFVTSGLLYFANFLDESESI